MEQTRFFTTGMLSKLFGVAPRTVSKWIDSGRLQGYRIPGSRDRRVTREQVAAFIAANNLPDFLAKEGGGR